MSLPFSHQHPAVQIMQFGPQSPPTVPVVQVMPVVQPLLPAIASAVANEAGLKANANSARMFCYNCLVNNFWNNEDFAEVVKLAADLIALNLNKQLYRTPDAGLYDAVSQIMTLYTSNLVFLFPELKSVCAPQVVDASFQNVPVFNNLKQEIQTMYNQAMQSMQTMQPGMQPMQPMMVPMQPGMQMYPGMQMPSMMPASPYPPVMQANMPAMMPYHAVPHQPNFQGMSPTPNQNTWSENRFPTNVTGGSPAGQTGNDLRQDRFFSRAANQPVQPVEQKPLHVVSMEEGRVNTAQTAVSKMADIATEINETGDNVDRAKHTISYFENSYMTDGVVRGRQFHESVAKLADTVPVEDECNEFLHHHWLLEESVDSALITGKIHQHNKQKENDSINVFRCFAIITNPILTSVDVRFYMETLRKSINFHDLGSKLKSVARTLTLEDDEMKKAQIITFLSQIENRMTAIVNNFLKNNLELSTTIDSFSEDAGQLGAYLGGKYGKPYELAFKDFEKDVIETMLETMDKETEQSVTENLGIPPDLYFVAMPVNHSLTFIFMNNKELGYNLGDGPLEIDPRRCPTLYKIASSLKQHKKHMQMTTLVDLLITADGVRYKLHEHALKVDTYLISRA